MRLQNVSITYHTIRGQEFVKLYVLFNLLEVFEKVRENQGSLSVQ